MRQTTQDQPQPFNSITESTPAARSASGSGQTVADKVGSAAHAVREQVEDRGAEIIDQAKQKAGRIYDQANKSLNGQTATELPEGVSAEERLASSVVCVIKSDETSARVLPACADRSAQSDEIWLAAGIQPAVLPGR